MAVNRLIWEVIKVGVSFHDERRFDVAVVEIAEGFLEVLEVLLEGDASSRLFLLTKHFELILSPVVAKEVASTRVV